MKKTTALLVFMLYSFVVFGQENRLSLSVGYPINFTNHWLVDKWENPVSFDIGYTRINNSLVLGGGVNFSNFDVSWSRYYDSEKNSLSLITPYVQVGINYDKSRVNFIPHINLGYSALLTDIEKYNGGKGGFYTAAGLDCNFELSDKIFLGLGTNYTLIFNGLDFKYGESIPTDFIPVENDVMKSLEVKLNLVYRL